MQLKIGWGSSWKNVGTFVWIASSQSATSVKQEPRSQRIMSKFLEKMANIMIAARDAMHWIYESVPGVTHRKHYGDFRKLTRGTHCTICKTCERPPCFNCGKPYPAGVDPFTGHNTSKSAQYYCSKLCKYPLCHFQGCGRERPVHKDYIFFKMSVWHCAQHREQKREC